MGQRLDVIDAVVNDPDPSGGNPFVVDEGPAHLPDLTSVDLGPARTLTAGVELVLASDVDNPLLGINGATKVYGPQKNLPEELVAQL